MINLINLEEIFWKRSISAAGNALFSRERSRSLPKRSITGPSQFPFFFVLMLQAHMCNILSIHAFICTLLRGQLSEKAANVGLALERHFVGLLTCHMSPNCQWCIVVILNSLGWTTWHDVSEWSPSIEFLVWNLTFYFDLPS